MSGKLDLRKIQILCKKLNQITSNCIFIAWILVTVPEPSLKNFIFDLIISLNSFISKRLSTTSSKQLLLSFELLPIKSSPLFVKFEYWIGTVGGNSSWTIFSSDFCFGPETANSILLFLLKLFLSKSIEGFDSSGSGKSCVTSDGSLDSFSSLNNSLCKSASVLYSVKFEAKIGIFKSFSSLIKSSFLGI